MLLSLRFSFSDTHRLIIFINIILKGFSSVYRTKPFFIILGSIINTVDKKNQPYLNFIRI